MVLERDHFVAWFRDAAPYINAHRGRCFVIQFSGEIVASPNFRSLIHDLGLLDSLGIKLVLVHGTRPQIEQRLDSAGLRIQYQQGMRITATNMMPVIKEAIGATRIEIEAMLSMGSENSPMAGKRLRVASGNFISAYPVGIIDGVNYHHTGRVRRVDTDAIYERLNSGAVVLISPLGYSPTGDTFNLHTEEIATTLAIELHAAKLIFINDAASSYSALTPFDNVQELRLDQAQALLHQLRRRATIDEIDLAPLKYAVQACHNGVDRTHLLDYSIDGSMLLELFTRDGVGIMINADSYDTIRCATMEDAGGIIGLITPLETEGKLLRRSHKALVMEIDDYLVIERDGAIIGCAAAHCFKNAMITELACLAVHKNYQRNKRGEQLLHAIEAIARQQGSTQLFVLTTQAEHWFIEHGFNETNINALPPAKYQSYNQQRGAKILIKAL